MAHKNFGELMKRFCTSPILKGTYAEHMYANYEWIEKHSLIQDPATTLMLRYKVPLEMKNMNGTVHGGALATIIDSTTTIAIL